jgi:hypothetical protein
VVLRTFTALNAVVGPQGLWAVAEADLFKGLLARVDGGERFVVGGVPILGEDDVLKERSDAMDSRDYGVGIRNGKRTTGAEIILHVNNEKDILRSDLYRGHVLVPILCSLWPVERLDELVQIDMRDSKRRRPFPKFPVSVKMA